jgi:hypothetical protein
MQTLMLKADVVQKLLLLASVDQHRFVLLLVLSAILQQQKRALSVETKHSTSVESGILRRKPCPN